MATSSQRPLLRLQYEKAAAAYLASLPLEHFMEATTQATQRKITVASLDLVQLARPDIQTFSELLVQYPRKGEKKPGQVVPDNMVVVHSEPIEADGSYDTPFQPVAPRWMLEYVSKNSQRKDYEESMDKYENELKTPYYLVFYPEAQELTLYRHNKRRYIAVRMNKQGRLAIPDLEIEVALHDDWVRFWFRGEMLPLPTELQLKLQQAEQRASLAEQEVARLRALLAQYEQQKPS